MASNRELYSDLGQAVLFIAYEQFLFSLTGSKLFSVGVMMISAATNIMTIKTAAELEQGIPFKDTTLAWLGGFFGITAKYHKKELAGRNNDELVLPSTRKLN